MFEAITSKIKTAVSISSIPIVFASLCCLSPVILVLIGVSSVSFAASLADVFYGQYKWVFRFLGLCALAVSFVYYLRQQKGVCTFDDALRRRNEIINEVAIALIVAVCGYMFFLYVVVHYVGVWLSIWK